MTESHYEQSACGYVLHGIVNFGMYNEGDGFSTLSGDLTWRLCSKLALDEG